MFNHVIQAWCAHNNNIIIIILLLSFFLFCAEYAKRFAIFQHNLVRARKMQEMEKGSAKYGVTVFSDLTGKVTVLSR